MIETLRKPLDMDSKKLRPSLPVGPGVYLYKDKAGRVIYVGKAKNLKKRILSYFKPLSELPQKTAHMMNKAESVDYILTATENEAFILENSLVKKHMPRYNIILRDDKQFPSLRLDIREPYPRLEIVRKIRKDGSIYFGPFSSAGSVRSTLKLIDKIFQLRKCRSRHLPKRSRPCLNYQLNRCLGPCTRNIPDDTYREIVDQVRLFLDGRNRELVKHLEDEMKRFSDRQNFEEAARVRDQMRAVEKTIERQNVVSPRMEDQDVIGLAQESGMSQLIVLFIRKGCLTGRRDFSFRDSGASPSEITEAFIKQYYLKGRFIPGTILISDPIGDLGPITDWLSETAGKKIRIHNPIKGEKRRLTDMAVSNAEDLLARGAGAGEEDLLELTRSVLRLERLPRRIEGLDISNFQGDMAVGTVVSFLDGLPYKSEYRNYRIKQVDGIDDYGMMSELVFRRLSGDNPPDLFLVDGGKGHLQAVKRVMDSLPGRELLPELAAIAKAGEKGTDNSDRIYLYGRKNPVILRPDHPVLFLLMRIRDEAHRRAVSYHRKLRGKSLKESRLDKVPGIGPKRKKELLKNFKDVDTIAGAKPEDLARVPGISKDLARDIAEFFRRERLTS